MELKCKPHPNSRITNRPVARI